MLKSLKILVAWVVLSGVAHGVPVDWTMINVNTKTQGDAHLLEWESGEKFLVDAGTEGEGASNFLKMRNIGLLDAVIVTHAHRDHYGGLKDILSAGIQVKKVYFMRPPLKACAHEKPWGCDLNDVDEVMSLLRKKSIPVVSPQRGQTVFSDKDSSLRVLYAHDGVSTPVGETDINDTSVILMLSVGGKKALLTGDLNELLGAHLAKHAKDIKADILKAPHHGTEGCAPDEFFAAVGAKIVLVPAPKGLWESDRSARMRKYFSSRAKQVWVNGVHGDILVKLSPTKIHVQTLGAALGN